MTRLIRGLINVPANWPGSVVTIGNFDGLHRGHQALINSLKKAGQRLGVPTVLLTFEPLPAEFFASKATVRLSDFREKFRDLEQLGVDYLCVCRFTENFAALSAADFIRRVLQRGLRAKHVIVGDDFRFGQQRQGDFALLEQTGPFTVEALPTVAENAERVSSTLLRQALQSQDFVQAENLLGHPYAMRGRVIHGDKLGRELGFPTANLLVKRQHAALAGVYIVRVKGVNNTVLPGVACIGVRPTVGVSRHLLEVHIFNYQGDLYGKELQIEFCQKIRDEVKFQDLPTLQLAMQDDARIAREFHHLSS